MEYNTLPKNDFHTIQVNEAGPQQDYVSYKKPCLADATTDKKTRLDLEELLQENHDAFVSNNFLNNRIINFWKETSFHSLLCPTQV